VPTPHPLYTRAFWTACAIHFTGAMSFGLFLLFPLFVRALGGDELTIGLTLGTGLAASVAVRPWIGTLLDRIGRRRVLLWSGAVNTLSYPLFLLLRDPGVGLYALATLHLVVGGALFASYFTYAADLVPRTRRVEGIAIFGVAGMAPNGLGPALGEAVIARAGYPGLFLAATAFAALSLALTALVPAVRGGAAAVGPGPHDLARVVRAGGLSRVLVATMVFGVGVNAAFYFVAPYTRDLGLARAAPFFAAYATTTILVRVLGRRLLGRPSAHGVAVPAFAVFAAGLAALALLPAPGILVLAGVACGAGHGTLFPVLNALVVTRAPARVQGTIVSLYTAALDLGAVVGTPLCGAVARAAGYPAMFALTAAANVGALALVATDRGREPAAS
jgi:predicted MFS family arabinose efflux permease